MATEIIVTDEFRDWYEGLSQEEQSAIIRIVDLPEEHGPTLVFPFSSSIRGSRFAMRELRLQYGGVPYRILHSFDPLRRAVLLVGGVKIGMGNRWYEKAIRQAENLFADYLKRTEP